MKQHQLLQFDNDLPSDRNTVLIDFVVVILLLLFWIIYVGPIVWHEHRFGVDICRDLGTVMNMLSGRFFSDPAYLHETFWYPPLSPMIVAGLSLLTGVAPKTWYIWSPLLINWLIPVGLYVVTRCCWGARAGLFAVIALLLAMPWWQCEAAHGQPSIHAVAWGWIAIALYVRQERLRSASAAVLVGVFIGVSFWHHPFVPAVLTVGFLAQAMWQRRSSRRLPDTPPRDDASLRRHLIMLAISTLIAAPMVFQALHGPVLNLKPRDYMAEELGTVRFALMAANPWLWSMGIIGIVSCLRRAHLGARLLISVLVITTAAQLPGYLRLLFGSSFQMMPVFVPHEFQRLFQLAWAVAIGIGIDRTIHRITVRFVGTQARIRAAVALGAMAAALTGVFGLIDAPRNLRRYLSGTPLLTRFQDANDWIRRNTDVDAVFACEPDMAMEWLNSSTGRKVFLQPVGHSNPRVDWAHREGVLDALETAATPLAFWTLATDNDIDYVIPSGNWNPQSITAPSDPAGVSRYVRLVYGSTRAVALYEIVDSPHSANFAD